MTQQDLTFLSSYVLLSSIALCEDHFYCAKKKTNVIDKNAPVFLILMIGLYWNRTLDSPSMSRLIQNFRRSFLRVRFQLTTFRLTCNKVWGFP